MTKEDKTFDEMTILFFPFPTEVFSIQLKSIYFKGRRDYRSRRNRDLPVKYILLTIRLFVTVISKSK